MRFNYKARTKDGKLEIGSMEAYSKEAALSLLQKYNIFVVSLELEEKSSFFQKIKFQRNPSKKDLAIFFRQLAVMFESRVPLVESLSSLVSELKKTSFKNTILKVSRSVEEGVPFSQALSMHPETFSNFYVNLVRSGETSGKMALALYSISDHLEREYDIMSQVKQAVVYPLFLLSVLFFVIGVIITQIVPKIEDLFHQTGNKPTPFTAIMLNFYEFLEKYWWLIVIILFLLAVSLIYYLRTKEGWREYSEISLRVPFLGKLLKKVFLIRFCNNISVLLVAGISINQALRITEDTVDNISYKKVIANIEKEVSGGEKISSAMAKHPNYFPSFVLQITKVGEATGKVDKSLMDVVNFYEKEVKRSIDLFSRMLEPIMIIILGVVVTILAISVLSLIYGAIGTI